MQHPTPATAELLVGTGNYSEAEATQLTLRRSCSCVFNSNCFCSVSLSDTSCCVRSLFALIVSLHFVNNTSKRFTYTHSHFISLIRM